MAEFTEEELRLLMELGIIPDQISDLQGQLETANQMRQQPAPQGIDTGKTFVAASPLSFIGRGISQYKGGKRAGKLNEEIGGLRDEQSRLRGIYAQKAMGQPGQPSQPQTEDELRRAMMRKRGIWGT